MPPCLMLNIFSVSQSDTGMSSGSPSLRSETDAHCHCWRKTVFLWGSGSARTPRCIIFVSVGSQMWTVMPLLSQTAEGMVKCAKACNAHCFKSNLI